MQQAFPAFDADRPLYRQLIDHLRVEVEGLKPGSRITSETQLAKSFAVSRFTVARAIEALADEGLLYRRQGLGTFVAAPPLKRAPGYLTSFTEAVRASGHTPRHRLLEFGPVSWRADLPYGDDQPLIALDRVRIVDDLPTAIHRSVLSTDVVERIGLTRAMASNPRFSLYAALERSGLIVESAVERLAARPASADERALLNLESGAAVMEVTRHSFAADGSILDAVDAVYDARRYSYEARILRGRQKEAAAFSDGVNQENSHAFGNHKTYGPRLGPWHDDRGS